MVCVHYHSEGYTCWQQDEKQSEYFNVAKWSLNVTTRHHHAVVEVNGVVSTEKDPILVKEHRFVKSNDHIQGYNSVYKLQELIHTYDVGYNTEMLHEFTQYK